MVLVTEMVEVELEYISLETPLAAVSCYRAFGESEASMEEFVIGLYR